MTNFYMLVGLPGSGKSNIAKKMKEENPKIQIFSSDELRKELWGNKNTQGNNSVLFKELHNRIKFCLENGVDCIYDATNISSKRRIAFLNELKKFNDLNKTCIFVLTSIEKCFKNNKNRERKIPEEVIRNMYLRFEIPQYREGWDNIIIKRQFDRQRDYLKNMDKLRKIPHDNPHHLLSIGDHMCACTEYVNKNYALKINTYMLRILFEAAFFHDIGKPFTKVFKDSQGNDTDIAHYYGHENVSAYLYLLYCSSKELREEQEITLYVADLIGLHMRMFNIVKEMELGNYQPKEKLIKLIGKEKYNALVLLNQADIACS